MIMGPYYYSSSKQPTVTVLNRPYRGKRSKVKAARKAAKRQ